MSPDNASETPAVTPAETPHTSPPADPPQSSSGASEPPSDPPPSPSPDSDRLGALETLVGNLTDAVKSLVEERGHESEVQPQKMPWTHWKPRR